MNYLAIDVGGTFTKYAIITEHCEIMKKDKLPTVVASLEQFIDSLVEVYKMFQEEVEGIALSMPGIIDSKNGFMHTGGNLTFIDKLNIVKILEEKCWVPVTIENDAKCAALAEVWQGALKDCSDAVVLVCGTGVGGAIIKDRKVISGAHFMAGEFSYVMINSADALTLDHTLAGSTGVQHLINAVAAEKDIPVQQVDGEKIFQMANAGDETVLACLRAYVKRLAIQINNYQFILDPEKIAIGGGISVQPLFLQLIQEELQSINDVYPWDLPIAKVTVCQFFNDANLIGAVYVHIQAKGYHKSKEIWRKNQ